MGVLFIIILLLGIFVLPAVFKHYLIYNPRIKRIKKEFNQFIKSEVHLYLTNFVKKYAIEIESFIDFEARSKMHKRIDRGRSLKASAKAKSGLLNWWDNSLHNDIDEEFSSYDVEVILYWIFSEDITFTSNPGIISDIQNLREILKRKGFLIDNDQIVPFLILEFEHQKYEEIKEKLELKRPKNLEEFINDLLYICGSNWLKYIDAFIRILNDNKMEFKREEIIEKLKNIEKEIEIKNLENKLNSGHTLTMEDIDIMTGYEFEKFLKNLFEKMGYAVEETKLSGDQGADLVINKFSEKLVFQAKRYGCEKVSNSAIQEVVAAIRYYNANKGTVVTTSTFTKSAIELARSNGVDLIDRTKLDALIHHHL